MGARGEAGPAAAVERRGPILLYDGECGLCASSVQFVLRHDRDGTLRFAPLQGRAGGEIRRRHPELAGVDSVVWFEDDRVRVRSDAALRIAAYLGGGWRLGVIGYLIPRPLRDSIYDFIARHRHQLTGQKEMCRVPQAGERFLE